MPATTRSMSRRQFDLSSAPENAKPLLPSKAAPRTLRDYPPTVTPSNNKRNPAANKESRPTKQALRSLQNPPGRLSKHQSLDKELTSSRLLEPSPGLLRLRCLNAIGRFRPSVLREQSRESRGRAGRPIRSFQEELSSCVAHELHNVPHLSEYTETNKGKNYSQVFGRWGTAILQCNSEAEIVKHAACFLKGGKYLALTFLEDYIILNFCSTSVIREMKIEDVELQSHLLHIAMDPEKCIAKVYEHDPVLVTEIALVERRRAFYANETGSSSDKLTPTLAARGGS